MSDIFISGGRVLLGNGIVETSLRASICATRPSISMPKPRSASGWRPIASICSHLAEGRRADIILVDDEVPLHPRIVGVIAAGRLVHLTDARRLLRFTAAPRKAVAAA